MLSTTDLVLTVELQRRRELIQQAESYRRAHAARAARRSRSRFGAALRTRRQVAIAKGAVT